MTGQVELDSEESISVQGATIISARSPDLAKLHLKCHMNYSIIFTEISFYPETSIVGKKTCIASTHAEIKQYNSMGLELLL